MSPKDRRRVDDFILYAMAAADEAVRDANWMPEDEDERERTGVNDRLWHRRTVDHRRHGHRTAREGTARGVGPFFIPSALINLASGQVSIRYKFKGPNHAVVTACATGAHAIGDAARLIQWGDADVMVARRGGSSICKIGVAGFIACKAMSTHFNDEPTRGSRPYDKDRDGFVMGEGAGILVLEELEHAKARGAKIYAEVVGYGLAGDAYHITAPVENGDGGFRAMKMAFARAGIDPSISTTSTAHAPRRRWATRSSWAPWSGSWARRRARSRCPRPSRPSATCSAPRARWRRRSASWPLRDQIAPPTINLDNPSVESPIDLIPHKASR